jgi:hypothetical protein
MERERSLPATRGRPTMRWLTVSIGACCLLLAGCATAHPYFEQYFNASYEGAEYYNESPDHGKWMVLLATRYGCDTMPLRTAARGTTEMATGVPPCDIASAVPPGVIRAFNKPDGIYEEWRFGSGAQTMVVHFEGANPKALRSTFVQWY